MIDPNANLVGAVADQPSLASRRPGCGMHPIDFPILRIVSISHFTGKWHEHTPDICTTLCSNSVLAQSAGDPEVVKAASKALIAALEVIDDGTAMERVWANTPYVTLVGPRSKAIIVGWDAQKEYWIDNNKRFSTRQTLLLDQHIHVNGNLAWKMGLETGENTMKDCRAIKSDCLVTNVYEKQPNGRRLIVSHHAQPKPQ